MLVRSEYPEAKETESVPEAVIGLLDTEKPVGIESPTEVTVPRLLVLLSRAACNPFTIEMERALLAIEVAIVVAPLPVTTPVSVMV